MIFTPDVVLPSQWAETCLPVSKRPELNLMAAVLASANEDLIKVRYVYRSRELKYVQDAREWVLSRETRWPYSFENICAALGLDADAVRHELLKKYGRRIVGPLPTDTARLGGWQESPRIGYELHVASGRTDYYSITVCTPVGRYLVAARCSRRADALAVGRQLYVEKRTEAGA